MANKFLNLEGLSTLISLIKLQISKFAPGLLVTNKTESLEESNGEPLTGVINLHKVSKTGNYNDLLNTPEIPNKTSLLLNDTGFITIESDPTVPLHVKEITQQNIVNWNNKLGSETDPTVPSHVKNITQQDIINWNNKLDTYTETDPSVPNYVRNITQEDINNWNNKVDTADLATVATSGSYSDLSNKPIYDASWLLYIGLTTGICTLAQYNELKEAILAQKLIKAHGITPQYGELDLTPSVAQIYREAGEEVLFLAYVVNSSNVYECRVFGNLSVSINLIYLFSGDYDDLTNKPAIPNVIDNLTSTSATDALSANQGKTLKGMLDTYCPIIEDTRTSAVAAITGIAPFDTLVDGQKICLHFNAANGRTLELTLSNGTTTGAKNVLVPYQGSFYSPSDTGISNKSYILLRYEAADNIWRGIGSDKNNVYSIISQAEINEGTVTTGRTISPKLLRDNFYIKSEVNNICPIITDTRSSAVAEITGTAPFSSLVDGLRILLKFTLKQANNSTLKLTLSDGNDTTAYPIYYRSGASLNRPSATYGGLALAGQYVMMIFDYDNLRWLNIDSDTQYLNMALNYIDSSGYAQCLITGKMLRDNFYLKSEIDTIVGNIETLLAAL